MGDHPQCLQDDKILQNEMYCQFETKQNGEIDPKLLVKVMQYAIVETLQLNKNKTEFIIPKQIAEFVNKNDIDTSIKSKDKKWNYIKFMKRYGQTSVITSKCKATSSNLEEISKPKKKR